MVNHDQQKPRVLAVILARGGSKSVPRKNIRLILGVPLIAYTIHEALKSKFIDRLIVSTDSEEIRKVAVDYGAQAPFLRPEHLSTDTATSIDAMVHAADWVENEEDNTYDFVVELMPTNPMKTVEDIDAVLEKLITTKADSVIGVTKLDDYHPIRIKKIVNDRIEEFCLKEIPGSHRQQLKPDAYIRNGSIYACKRDCILTRVGTPNSRPYIMPADRSVNIDTENDLLLAEILLNKSPREHIKPIQQKGVDKKKGFSVSYVPKTDNEKRVLITTVPFGDYENSPIELLNEKNINYSINPLGRKPTEDELAQMIGNYGILLAGTSPITRRVMDQAPHLKLIARAGIGLDNVDLEAAKERGIAVTYTPHAPAPAVAEFTVSLMLSTLRHIHRVDHDMHSGNWNRQIGRRIGNCTVGLLGVGSIGRLVIKNLSSFGAKILAFDLKPDYSFGEEYQVQWVDQEQLFKEADVISLHLPITKETKYLIGANELAMMKESAVVINTSRGGIIKEDDLCEALNNGQIAGAALDVFENEPYEGPLTKLDNCLLTCHMAAASLDCKSAMEFGATEEILRFLQGKPLAIPVPEILYS